MLAKRIFNWRSLRLPLPSCHPLHVLPTAARVRWSPRRAFSRVDGPPHDWFEYTKGKWITNDKLRHEERRRVFNVDGLLRLAAKSVGRSPHDILDLKKLGEGGANRAFLITLDGGLQIVARIPYPVIVPKGYVVASEVATIDLLRSWGVPIPRVLGYSFTPANDAETEYILLELAQGVRLGDIWSDLGKEGKTTVLRHLAEIESKVMSRSLPAGGSVYYPEDLDKLLKSTSYPGRASRPGVLLEDDKRFCVGPDTSLHLWHGRRSQLDVNRGPYTSPDEALRRGAEKELAFLQQFGRPLLPFQRVRRAAYGYQAQQPSVYIENLHYYLRIASSLIPRDSDICHFCISHPDLQPNNIFVSPDLDLSIVALIDWQHTSVLPLFLHADTPQRLQKDEEASYLESTKKHNPLHYLALTGPVAEFSRRLFRLSGEPWEGESIWLKLALIEAAEKWETLTEGGSPCPIEFDPDDVRKTREMGEEQQEAEDLLDLIRGLIGVGAEGWVRAEDFEEAMESSKKVKKAGLEAADPEERDLVAEHWFFDDMDETPYE